MEFSLCGHPKSGRGSFRGSCEIAWECFPNNEWEMKEKGLFQLLTLFPILYSEVPQKKQGMHFPWAFLVLSVGVGYPGETKECVSRVQQNWKASLSHLSQANLGLHPPRWRSEWESLLPTAFSEPESCLGEGKEKRPYGGGEMKDLFSLLQRKWSDVNILKTTTTTNLLEPAALYFPLCNQ